MTIREFVAKTRRESDWHAERAARFHAAGKLHEAVVASTTSVALMQVVVDLLSEFPEARTGATSNLEAE